MRLVPVNSIIDGTILARTIYNNTGIPLLRAGYPLNEQLVKKAINNGINSLYIQDAYSDEIIADVISPEFRQRAVHTLKNSFKSMYKVSMGKTSSSQKNFLKSIQDINQLAMGFVDNILSNRDVVVNLVDIKTMDDYTYQHSVNTAVLAIVLGIELGYHKNYLQSIAVGALLHDFGKVFIPKSILIKPGKLTDGEFEVMRSHPILGYNYLNQHLDLDTIALSIIYGHHEKIDGSGYPNNLFDRKISVFAKMIAVCDVYDALTSDRPYRRAMSPNDALELIMGSCGMDFDLNIVRAFIRRIVPYPIGTLVRLSNEAVGVVKTLNDSCVLRPVVQLVDVKKGEKTAIELDLVTQTNIVIKGIYNEEKSKN